MKYKHIFFDLDHTLWDHEKNSYETLNHLNQKHKISEICNASFEAFHQKYSIINHRLWQDYNQKKIEKSLLRWKRFNLALNSFDVENEILAKLLADEYLELCPKGTHLINDVHEVLEYLAPKYHLHILTNGFKEAQHTKINSSNLGVYFKEVFISEELGHFKPSREIFDVAMDKLETFVHSCLMVGDNIETDIAGAQNAGMDYYYFNPEKVNSAIREDRQIFKLMELVDLL